MHVCFGKFITDFTIFESRMSIVFFLFLFFFFVFVFSFLDYHCLIFFICFVFNNILKDIWNSCCNDLLAEQWGGAMLGGGGSALQTVCCWGGGGGQLRNKYLAGRSPKK